MSYADQLRGLSQKLGRPVPPEAIEHLVAYAQLVETWNARLNLIGATDFAAVIEVLFADALMLSSHTLVPLESRLIDVGTGAGAPAIPLLLLRDDVTCTLVEPIHKRVAFLRTCIGTLHLMARTKVVEGKIEDGEDPATRRLVGAPFDIAMSRATLPADRWVPLGLQLASRVALFAAGAASFPATQRVAAETYALPSTTAPRFIGIYESSRSR